MNKRCNYYSILTGLLILLMFFVLLAICTGRYYIPPSHVLKIGISKLIPIDNTWDEQSEQIILVLRLPRIVAAILVGTALTVAGTSYQGIFKNPLVSPDLLGVSSGACVGASLAILLNFYENMIQVSAFIGGMTSVLLTTIVCKAMKTNSTVALILAGVIISGMMNSILGLIKFLADPETQLVSMIHWQLGSLSSVVWNDIYSICFPFAISFLILIILRWKINIISLGDNEAKMSGINIKCTRGLIVLCSTVLTACSVCISGTISWIGLVVPHLGRFLVGTDNCKLIPVSAILGACFLLFVDTISRTIISSELPLSILTGLLGTPFYLYLLIYQRGKYT